MPSFTGETCRPSTQEYAAKGAPVRSAHPLPVSTQKRRLCRGSGRESALRAANLLTSRVRPEVTQERTSVICCVGTWSAMISTPRFLS
jgi:hypothetical protein